MRINENHGIVVGPGGQVTGGARVSNVSKEEKHIMNNKFNAPVGVVAETAHDFTQVQEIGSSGALDMKALAAELSKLRVAARQEATEAEHDAAVGEIAQAESAAKSNDENKVLEHLAKAGQWALDIATKIGTTVATEALKKAFLP